MATGGFMHGKIRRKKLGEGELMLLLLLLLERVVTIMHSRKLEDFSLSSLFTQCAGVCVAWLVLLIFL